MVVEDIAWMAPAGDGRHLFKDSGGKWGFLGEDGNVAIKPEFCGAGAFGNGLAPVRLCP